MEGTVGSYPSVKGFFWVPSPILFHRDVILQTLFQSPVAQLEIIS